MKMRELVRQIDDWEVHSRQRKWKLLRAWSSSVARGEGTSRKHWEMRQTINGSCPCKQIELKERFGFYFDWNGSYFEQKSEQYLSYILTVNVLRIDSRDKGEAGKSVRRLLQQYRLKVMVTGTKGVAVEITESQDWMWSVFGGVKDDTKDVGLS